MLQAETSSIDGLVTGLGCIQTHSCYVGLRPATWASALMRESVVYGCSPSLANFAVPFMRLNASLIIWLAG